jgi:hypothetical protein
VQVVDFNGRTVGGFVALSGNGRLSATIVNNGTIDASYYLSVVNCSAGVALIPSPGALAVAAGGVRTQQWACAVEDDAAAGRNCTVVLQDARFVTIDTRLVRFYTNATAYDAIPQLDGRAVGTGVGAPQGGSSSCAEQCPVLLDLLCCAVHFCWARLAQGLLLLAFLLAVAYWVFVRCGPCKLATLASRNLRGSKVAADAPERGCSSQRGDMHVHPHPHPHAHPHAHVVEMHTPQRAQRHEVDAEAQMALELAAVDALLAGGVSGSGDARHARSPRRWSGGGTPTRSAALLAEYTRREREHEANAESGSRSGRKHRRERRR